MKRIFFVMLISLGATQLYAQSTKAFTWPNGKEAAISLSFDDGRTSQPDAGLALLDSFGVKATFYVVPDAVKAKLDGWKKVVASGHEIGNHSYYHPCSGNFAWSRNHALENYTLDSMKYELTRANDSIYKFLGVKPTVFAYPCGQKFVGRGTSTKSYVPLIAEMFLTGRGYMEETANDPVYTDFAQITGINMDSRTFEEILPIIEEARKNGQWVVLAGHEMGEVGAQTTKLSMLRKLIAYTLDEKNKVWIGTVGEIAKYVESHR